MESPSSDILKPLMQLMNNQQHKLDRVMERLDTLQNIMEKQNQKQISLDDKLVEMTIKRHQENADMTVQLQKALQEITKPFSAIESQEGCTPSPQKTPQPLQSLGAQIGDTLKSIDNKTVDTAHTCHQLISWTGKMEDKMSELADRSVEMKTFLVEIRSVKDLIKGQTNSELLWLNNQIDKKLSDIGSAVRDIHRLQTEAKEDTVVVTGQVGKTGLQQGNITEPINVRPQLSTNVCDKQMQAILEMDRNIKQLNLSLSGLSRDVKTSLDTILITNKQCMIDLENKASYSVEKINKSSKEQSLLINERLKSDLNKVFVSVQEELQTNRRTTVTESETQSSRIISAVEQANENLRHLIQIKGGNTSKYKVELGNIDTSINSILDCLHGHSKTLLDKVDCTAALMIKQMEKLSAQTTSNKQLENLTTDLRDYLCETKREVFAVTEKEIQTLRHWIHDHLVSLNTADVAGLESESSKVIKAVETAKEELRHLIQTEGDNTGKYKGELVSFRSSVSSLLNRIQGDISTVSEKVVSTKASIASRHKTVIELLEEISTHTTVTELMEELSTPTTAIKKLLEEEMRQLTNDLKDYIYQTKREIFAVTEKEAQIVRDRIQGPLVSLGNYTFDLYVDNFKTLVRSGKEMYSIPWYINELQTCVIGYVQMSTNGAMQVWLMHGRHPREVGLQTRSAKTLKVKATICDNNNKKLQSLDIGEKIGSFNEAVIETNFYYGYKIGVTSCDVLLEKGYGKQEGYARGALLIRYDVTVV